ncbi:uncharacterized protein LOC125179215 [Hyalella azteca]|uniref:Uncharacterized protein LOC125179215 n=1 Tax=Hyalella azteca TaxID=294128 RepID=A0A979FVI4_HYAAZ|nr:uncharacterized protein LOC125179215 [Hyalella azteca]
MGEEPPPDLIVIGYSTWMSLLLHHPTRGRPTLTLMDDQWRIHAAVLRMLLNMRENTRVLFLAQNIHKQHAVVEKLWFHNEKSSQDQWLYFSELGWLNLRTKFTSNYVPNYTRKNKSYFWRAVFASRRNAVSSPKNSIPFQGRFKMLTEEKPSITDGSDESHQIFHSDAEGHADVWFWDSTLPLSFALLRDCDTLFNHDPMSAKMIALAYNIDAYSHLTYVYGLLQKLNVSRDDFFQRVNRLSDKVHADHLFFQLRPNAEKNSNTFFRQMKTYPGNWIVNISGSSVKSQEEFVNKLNEYYDTFATAYSMPDLYCRDLTHAGYLVKQVEAMQILNMICNQFMDLDHNYCCNNNNP